MEPKELSQLAITTIRTLAIDTVEKANSGHPGLPMGAAPMAFVLWSRFLRHNPRDPHWPNRDRFVLSAGHGSALLYSLLHLSGYDLPLSELQRFRQLGSKTPGHPEFGWTPGVETTTGPLGQGFATAVGMAMAERFLAATFNRDGFPVVDHYTYAIVSDGDLMEGVSSEAASLAGHLGLGKIIFLYDDNHISIEGGTDLAFSEDVLGRFAAYGWHTDRVTDGNDTDAIADAIRRAQGQGDQPSLIAVRNHIGFGSPHRQDTKEVHGTPLGAEETALTKAAYGWTHREPFYVPDEVHDLFVSLAQYGQRQQSQWEELWASYRLQHADFAHQLHDAWDGTLPSGWDAGLPDFAGDSAMATRSASGKVLNQLARKLPTLIGGSADLAPSTDTHLEGGQDFSAANYRGRNLHFGVREHAMGAILNGMNLHRGLRVYGGTFLIFSDYMRPAIRLACLMHQPVIYVFTHDSIALGEDGPTHQPVEQLASLRALPNLTVLRPADANETREAWKLALARQDGPTALILSRQKLPVLAHVDPDGVAHGAYVIGATKGPAQALLMATGSEVHLALAAAEQLDADGLPTRVVSMPSWELFNAASPDYREQVLPRDITARVAIEAGVPMGWERYVGTAGQVIGMTSFGTSAPGDVALEHFGFTVDHIVQTVKSMRQSS